MLESWMWAQDGHRQPGGARGDDRDHRGTQVIHREEGGQDLCHRSLVKAY